MSNEKLKISKMRNLIEDHHRHQFTNDSMTRPEYLLSIKKRRTLKINLSDLIDQKRYMCKKAGLNNGWDIRGLSMLQKENLKRWEPIWTPQEIRLLRGNTGKTCQNIHTIINERFGVSKRL